VRIGHLGRRDDQAVEVFGECIQRVEAHAPFTARAWCGVGGRG
jgi:hypothetical protein